MKRIVDKKLEEIIEKINKKNLIKRYLLLLAGSLVAAFAFNLFFLRYNIVCFGVSGIAIVLKEFGIEPSTFILLANIFLLIITYFFLGVTDVKNQIVGAVLYPILIKLTLPITSLIDFEELEMIVIAIFGGILAGIGYGLIYKSGFQTGGTDVIGLLICKYSKITMGSAMMIVNFCIVILGKIVFSWEIVMYALVVAYLISVATDKILLGISNSKAFYIVTDSKHDNIIRDFLNSVKGAGCTILNASNDSSGNKQSLILAVAPTKSYFIIKEGLKEIDDSVFYLVCDSYEVIHKEDIYE